MQQTLIHYGPFKRTPGLDNMIHERIKSITEHFADSGTQKPQIWLDRIHSTTAKKNFFYRCKIEIHPQHGKHLFVDKMDQNLFAALNRARKALLNLLDHGVIKREKRVRKAKLKTNWEDTHSYNSQYFEPEYE